MNATPCPRCGAAIEPAQKIFCQSCGTAHHANCYYQAGCAMQTCASVNVRPATVAAAPAAAAAAAPAMQLAQPQPCVYPPGYYPKSRLGYILLGVFLGTLGIHNFYAGYTGRAVAQLLVTVLTFGLGGIVTFIWAIVEVCTVDRDARGVPFTN